MHFIYNYFLLETISERQLKNPAIENCYKSSIIRLTGKRLHGSVNEIFV